MNSKLFVFSLAHRVKGSLLGLRGSVGQIKIVVDMLDDLVGDIDRWVSSVKLDVELLHVHLVFLVGNLLYRLTIIVLGFLLIQELFLLVCLFLFVLLCAKKRQTYQHQS